MNRSAQHNLPPHPAPISASGETTIDALMCFQCGDMVIHRDNTSAPHQPVWSLQVRDAMNTVLDQARIRRDTPEDSEDRLETMLKTVIQGGASR